MFLLMAGLLACSRTGCCKNCLDAPDPKKTQIRTRKVLLSREAVGKNVSDSLTQVEEDAIRQRVIARWRVSGDVTSSGNHVISRISKAEQGDFSG